MQFTKLEHAVMVKKALAVDPEVRLLAGCKNFADGSTTEFCGAHCNVVSCFQITRVVPESPNW